MIRWVPCLVVVAVVAGVGCSKHSKGDRAGGGSGGTITDETLCGGDQTVEFSNRVFEVTSGPAILAGGNCKVTLTGCTIRATAPGFGMGAVTAGGSAHVVMTNTKITGPSALMAGGSAEVEISGGALEGNVALEAGGSARVVAKGVSVKGAVNRGGSAVVEGIHGSASGH